MEKQTVRNARTTIHVAPNQTGCDPIGHGKPTSWGPEKVMEYRTSNTDSKKQQPAAEPERKYVHGKSPPMGTLSRNSTARSPSYLFPSVIALASLSLTVLIIYKVDDFVSQTKTVAGHNLDPTPWHPFPPKNFIDETRQSRAYKIIQCSYLTCGHSSIKNTGITTSKRVSSELSRDSLQCPEFFRWIRRDLEPWARTRISKTHIAESKNYADLYVDLYYACVQSRAMFTFWGLLQLLRRYPGMIPDVDIMFDCMDKPSINRTEHADMPLPLFRYCTTQEHFDIPFPDWSFWGWPEINIRPWDDEFQDIKNGSQAKSWLKRGPLAYWKGNPDVGSPIRTDLLQCNDTRLWKAQIMRQDWLEEGRMGFQQSKLSNQCNHRYKIYAEGFAWSVSLKYIISCGSLPLIITPPYEDFFSCGLVPMKNYWPVSSTDICQSIKFAVDWGNTNPHKAMGIGKAGQDLMENLNMDRVYDYMFHLISEYSKLQDFKPVPPPSALEMCEESVLCLADSKQKQFRRKSIVFPSSAPPCTLQPSDSNLMKNLAQLKRETIKDVKDMQKLKQKNSPKNANK